MKVYIQSANQISAQKPLSDEWFDNPVYCGGRRAQTVDPVFAGHFSPLAARRMCTLLKRAVMMSRLTLRDASTEMPDAIISGTGLGCIENTEKFLHAIMENDETCLQPTFFMQSTHNVLSSSIAIDLKCHGYNNTFVHRGVSFENAVLDAFMQFERHRVRTALVGGYDELTDDYYRFFDRIGIWDFVPGATPGERCFAGEAAVSMLLGVDRTERTICEINGVELMYRPTPGQLGETLDGMLARAGCGLSGVDAVLTGLNTHALNDAVYRDATARFFGNRPVMRYKHLFGESFSSSALGAYVAVTCLRRGRIPSFLLDAGGGAPSSGIDGIDGVRRILVYNHYRNRSHSLILLSSCLN
ncbi:MAG: beta-ketoacyl synthase chain length factor [Tannerella sp.]|jgi:3-oxoacyl-(acyl-carrier-protein) synthase|nr:beta-ketoacyl synthase chain length factor [Tannerella sp.]